jgi:hypothetical protein
MMRGADFDKKVEEALQRIKAKKRQPEPCLPGTNKYGDIQQKLNVMKYSFITMIVCFLIVMLIPCTANECSLPFISGMAAIILLVASFTLLLSSCMYAGLDF